ncbi:hypothetical protein BJV74DRAFT_885206 [Russula compacta]|nr:hypothetical protein BJV74DRAFT_885206 [Russula compacta]
MPSFWHDSPYYSPLSSTGWLLCSFVLWTVCVPVFIFISISLIPFRNARKHYKSSVDKFLAWFGEGVKKEAEEVASKGLSEIDGRILEWTTDALSEDDALEEFLGATPGFYKSDVVNDLQHLPLDVLGKILHKITSFLNHFLSSNSVPASVKIRRPTICLNAAGEVGTSIGVEYLFCEMPLGSWHGAPHSVEVGHYLTSWSKANNGQLLETRNRRWSNPYDIVIKVRHLYVALHQDTEGAPTALTAPDYGHDDIVRQVSSYPLCSIPSHRSDSTHVHELSAAETPHCLTTTSINVPHCDTVLATPTPSSLPASHPGDSTPHQSNEPSLAIDSSLSAPQLSPSNLATSDFHSTPPAMTCIPEAVFIPSSSTIISPQRTDNYVDLRSFQTSSSQPNEVPPNQGLPSPNSGHEALGAPDDPLMISRV